MQTLIDKTTTVVGCVALFPVAAIGGILWQPDSIAVLASCVVGGVIIEIGVFSYLLGAWR